MPDYRLNITTNGSDWFAVPNIVFRGTTTADSPWTSYWSCSSQCVRPAEEEPALEETPELNEFWASVPITKEEDHEDRLTHHRDPV